MSGTDPGPEGSAPEASVPPRALRRFPRAVFGRGDEPDVRFTLANERTFLAWIRTSLALLAAGVALEALDLPIAPGLSLAASLIFLALGTLLPLQAWWSWVRVEQALRMGRALPSPQMAGPLAIGTLVAGLLVLVGLLVP
jgi:putative membrane protein